MHSVTTNYALKFYTRSYSNYVAFDMSLAKSISKITLLCVCVLLLAAGIFTMTLAKFTREDNLKLLKNLLAYTKTEYNLRPYPLYIILAASVLMVVGMCGIIGAIFENMFILIGHIFLMTCIAVTATGVLLRYPNFKRTITNEVDTIYKQLHSYASSRLYVVHRGIADDLFGVFDCSCLMSKNDVTPTDLRPRQLAYQNTIRTCIAPLNEVVKMTNLIYIAICTALMVIGVTSTLSGLILTYYAKTERAMIKRTRESEDSKSADSSLK